MLNANCTATENSGAAFNPMMIFIFVFDEPIVLSLSTPNDWNKHRLFDFSQISLHWFQFIIFVFHQSNYNNWVYCLHTSKSSQIKSHFLCLFGSMVYYCYIFKCCVYKFIAVNFIANMFHSYRVLDFIPCKFLNFCSLHVVAYTHTHINLCDFFYSKSHHSHCTLFGMFVLLQAFFSPSSLLLLLFHFILVLKQTNIVYSNKHSFVLTVLLFFCPSQSHHRFHRLK